MSFRAAPFLLLALLLAGCAEDAVPAAEPAAETPEGGPLPRSGAPDVPVEPGSAPHVHDLWEGRERMLLLEADYTVEPPDAAMWALMSSIYVGETSAGGFFVELPEDSFVPEGTGRLEILASWTDPAVTGLRFLHRHAGSGEVQPWTVARNGEVLALEVAPHMTDMPHAAASRWIFLFMGEGTPALALGTVHLKMEAVRTRDPTLYPGHPDLWGDATELPRLDAEGITRTSLAPDPFPERGFEEPEGTVPVEAPIPMETGELVVTVEVLSLTPSTRPLASLRLLHRAADDMAFDLREVDAEPETSDGRTWTWRVDVDMRRTDSPYAQESAWAFLAMPVYESPAPTPCECHEAELRYRITALAVREAPPAAGAPAASP